MLTKRKYEFLSTKIFSNISFLNICVPLIILVSVITVSFLNGITLMHIILLIVFLFSIILVNKRIETIFNFFNKKFNLIENYKTKLFYSEINENPFEYSKKMVLYLLLYTISSILSLFMILYFKLSFWFVIIVILGNAYLVFILFYPSIKTNQISSGVEKEIQMLYALLSSFLTVGINPYLTLSVINENPFFSFFKKVFNQIEKIKILYILNPMDAIAKYSRIAQSDQLRDLLQTISASETIELHKLIKNKMIDSFKLLEKRIENLLEKFNILLASQLLVFILVPITMIVTAIFTGLDLGLALVIFILVPILFFVAFFFMLRTSIPSHLSLQISLDYKYGGILLIAITPLLGIFYLKGIIGLDNLVFIALMSFLLCMFYFNYKKQSIYEILISSIPKVFREIAEETKKGISPSQALEKVIERVEEIVKLFIKKLLFSKRLGLSITSILTKENLPLLFKQLFSILEYTDQVGADPSIYNDLADFVERLDNSRRVYKIRTRFFKYSSYFVTALLGVSISISISVLGSLINAFGSIVTIYTISSFLSFNTAPYWIYLIANISAYINSAMLGYLGGSLGYDHVEGFKNAMICMLIAFFVLQTFNLIGIWGSNGKFY
jgi:hypothetical protein